MTQSEDRERPVGGCCSSGSDFASGGGGGCGCDSSSRPRSRWRTLIFVIVVLAAIGVGVYSLLADPAAGPLPPSATCATSEPGGVGSAAANAPGCCSGAAGAGEATTAECSGAAPDSAQAPAVSAGRDSVGLSVPGSGDL